MIRVLFVLGLFISIGVWLHPALAITPLPGYRFAFLNHQQREFTEEESQYIATHYDLAVVGFQSDPMIASARRIKEINPNIKLFVYFPTSIRQDGARYGQNEFQEAWYLHDLQGNRVYKTQTLAFIDLSHPEYGQWARTTVTDFLNQAPFDGVVFDNANPLGVEGNTVSWVTRIGQTKLDAWNSAREQYLTQMHTMLTNRGKVTIYNGFHRAPSKINRTLGTLDITDGALNERFCYGIDSDGQQRVVSKEYQLEDIDLERSIGNRQKIVLQKINWEGNLNSLPISEQKRLGNFCFGIFLMGHVPGFTFFKFGDGYNLARVPQEYRINAETIDLPLGNPAADYHKSGWLLSRQFQNGFVVVNLDATNATWTAPRALRKFVSQSQYQQVAQNQLITVAAQTAAYFLLPDNTSTPSITPTPTTNSADLVDTGDAPGDQVNIFDYNLLLSDFGKTGSPGWIRADINDDGRVDIFDYNLLVGAFGT